MNDLALETRTFLAGKAQRQARSAQMVALQLCCGLDLSAVLAADRQTRTAALRRLERLIERERLRGCARHWSYDLNRHIALKQASDLVGRTLGRGPAARRGGVKPARIARKRKTAPEGAV